MDPADVHQHFVSYTNILKIVKYRGYNVPKEYDLSHEKYVEKYEDTNDIHTLKESMSGAVFCNKVSKITIEWYTDKKIGVGIRDLTTRMEKEEIKHALVVVDTNITIGCKDTIKNIKAVKHLIIDVWTLKESMIFVPDHVLVPKHRICSKKESNAVFSAYGIKPDMAIDMLPHIKIDDVMVKYLGAHRGQLIEITRPSDTNPSLDIIAYRLVV